MFVFGGNVPDDGYKIERSLRFNSADTPNITRTPPVASNRRIWTYSCWFKKTGTSDYLFAAGPQTNGTLSTDIRLDADRINFTINNVGISVVYAVRTTALLRDPSAWYHLVVAVETTHVTASERVRFYLNGSRITTFSTANYPIQNYDTQVNNNVLHRFGYNSVASGYDGYLTEVHFIDGIALGPEHFGETDTTTGVWKPKKYEVDIPVEYVLVAGGGGGGEDNTNLANGGGGAGGYRASISGESSGGGNGAETPAPIKLNTLYSLIVGAGGAINANGSNTVFGPISCIGGGRGSTFADASGVGGSGGGGWINRDSVGTITSVTGGVATVAQGFVGGSPSGSPTVNNAGYAGGGGGASAAGGAGSANYTGGAGGAGIASSITGSSVTRGGGGGGGSRSTPAGAGGAGGGGTGAGSSTSATAGTANTGGGGGGGGGFAGSGDGQPGQAGGSGVAILRYPSNYTATFSAGVTQTTTTVGANKVSVVTAAGPTDTVTFS